MAKVTLSKNLTNTTLFSAETNNGATTSSNVNISRQNELLFYAEADTGAASFAASITFSVSPDGTNFFPYGGILRDDNTANTGVSGITLNTAGSEVFTFRDVGAIHTFVATLTIANRNASTTVNVRFSARTEDD